GDGGGRNVQGLGQAGNQPETGGVILGGHLPLPVRHGEPAGAAQADMGQSRASTRRKSSVTRRVFHMCVSRGGSFATAYETAESLRGARQAQRFTGDHL